MPTPRSPKRRPTVLVVFPFCCDRIGHGNIQRTLAFATFLAENGVDVDLLYQGNPRVPSREQEFAAFRRVVRIDAWESADHSRLVEERTDFYATLEPPPENLMPGTALTAAVRARLDAIPYDAVISSYAWTAPIYEPMPRHACRIVDLQDIVSIHAQRHAAVTGHTSSFSMSAATERYLWTRWDVLIAITTEEAALIAPLLLPSQRLITIGHATPTIDGPEGDPNRIVYVGSDNPANRHAIDWLLRRVWPRVIAARPRARLRLVGFICDAVRATPLAQTPGLELAGYVESPEVELGAGAINVAPYLFGSGLKIKVVEAAAAGRAIVTTSIGVEGTGMHAGEHLLVADTDEDFATSLVTLLDDTASRRRLMAAARRHAARAFSAPGCYGPLIDLVQPHVLS